MGKQDPKPTAIVRVGSFTASQVNGTWFYKANQVPFALQAKPVPVVAKYKDPVQYRIMEEYEGAAETFYKSNLASMVKEIVMFLVKV